MSRFSALMGPKWNILTLISSFLFVETSQSVFHHPTWRHRSVWGSTWWPKQNQTPLEGPEILALPFWNSVSVQSEIQYLVILGFWGEWWWLCLIKMSGKWKLSNFSEATKEQKVITYGHFVGSQSATHRICSETAKKIKTKPGAIFWISAQSNIDN